MMKEKEIASLVDLLKPSVTTLELDGKYLVASTLSDGYTGTVKGTYVFEVKKTEDNYKVNELIYNKDKGTFEASDEPIIVTDENTIFFVTRTMSDPYNYPVISKETVKATEVKEKQILQAFIAFVEDRFKLGKYNVFLAKDPYIIQDKTEA